MPSIRVCPLSRLRETGVGASHLVTLMGAGHPVERPSCIAAERHLVLSFSDIDVPLEGHVMPDEGHVRALLSFVRAWDRERPLVMHCWAGISRSTAAAFVAACALRPDEDEAAIARELRAASPSATPNRRFVALGDGLLRRDGRMIAAAAAIGRGAEAFEGRPFALSPGGGAVQVVSAAHAQVFPGKCSRASVAETHDR